MSRDQAIGLCLVVIGFCLLVMLGLAWCAWTGVGKPNRELSTRQIARFERERKRNERGSNPSEP